jgi:hypothetical protein
MDSKAQSGQSGLWRNRYLVGGQIRITGGSAAARHAGGSGWFESAGRAWRRLPRKVQWIVAIALFVWLQNVAAPAGVVFAVVFVIFLAVTDPTQLAKRRQVPTPEQALAATGWIEAQVAGAACRAWEETVQEPSWYSPALAATRATFDGRREVDTIVDLALRIHAARHQLGAQPVGPAGEYWRQQQEALDRAALRLGDRADALIHHRDQAAALSAQLAQLAELERLERSALVVDDLTRETSASPVGRGLGSVSDQISAAHQAVSELIDLMTRTRAPLAEPAPPVVP